MKTRLPRLRPLALAGAAWLLLAVAPGCAHAAFLLTLTQAGGNVVASGSGTFNTAALSEAFNGSTSAFIVHPQTRRREGCKWREWKDGASRRNGAGVASQA